MSGKVLVVKRAYKIPMESFEKALIEMSFYKTRTTPMAIHYKRADGLHVVLSSRARKKGRPCREVERNVGKGKITLVKVHKDDPFTHRVIELKASERGKFLSELICIKRGYFKMEEYDTKRRCKWRTKRISWCRKLEKFCDSPYEYDKCPHYEPQN